METAEKTLMDMISVQDYCTTPLFMEEKVPVKSPQELSKKKADLQETESFYMDVSQPFFCLKTFFLLFSVYSHHQPFLLSKHIF